MKQKINRDKHFKKLFAEYLKRPVKVLQRYHHWLLLTGRGESIGRIKTVALRNAILYMAMKEQEKQLEQVIKTQKPTEENEN